MIARVKLFIRKNKKLHGVLRRVLKPYFNILDHNQKKIFLNWQQQNRSGLDQALFFKNPLISIIVPTYNTPADYLESMLRSVEDQTYKNWELVVVDDASTDRKTVELLKEHAEKNPKIRFYQLQNNLHIAGATNEGLRRARGEFVALLDHDDVLHREALAWIVRAINQNQDVKFIYSDEIKMDEHGQPYQPFFKPGWNFDLLRSVNYITHFSVISRDTIKAYGGEDGEYNGTQDWELFLRITRRLTPGQIVHVPRILYYWRVHKNSTAMTLDAKPYVVEAQRKALEEDARQRRVNAEVVRDARYGAQWQVNYSPPDEITFNIVPFNKNIDIEKLADTTKSNTIVFTDSKIDKETIELLASDALRHDIGAVSPRIDNEAQVINNLKSILRPEIIKLIAKLSRRSFTKHIYLTARYNLDEIEAPILVVERRKLMQLPPRTKANSLDISRSLSELGYRTVYNPYIRVKEGR